MNRVFVCDDQFLIEEIKDRLFSSNGDFLIDTGTMTLEQFVKEEVFVYWPLISDVKNKPVTISYNTSIIILSNIIENRRNIDGYFSAVNSSSISLAKKIYAIMKKSALNNIPAREIYNRIRLVKGDLNRTDLYEDIRNIIVEYENILENLGYMDLPMNFSIFKKLLEDFRYVEINKDRELKYFYKDYGNEMNHSLSFIKNTGIFSKDNIIEVNNTFFDHSDVVVDFNQKKEMFLEEKIEVVEVDNIFEMLIKLEDIIESALNYGIKSSDICICMDSYSPIYFSELENISKRLGCEFFYGSAELLDEDYNTIGAIISEYLIYKELNENIGEDIIHNIESKLYEESKSERELKFDGESKVDISSDLYGDLDMDAEFDLDVESKKDVTSDLNEDSKKDMTFNLGGDLDMDVELDLDVESKKDMILDLDVESENYVSSDIDVELENDLIWDLDKDSEMDKKSRLSEESATDKGMAMDGRKLDGESLIIDEEIMDSYIDSIIDGKYISMGRREEYINMLSHLYDVDPILVDIDFKKYFKMAVVDSIEEILYMKAGDVNTLDRYIKRFFKSRFKLDERNIKIANYIISTLEEVEEMATSSDMYIDIEMYINYIRNNTRLFYGTKIFDESRYMNNIRCVDYRGFVNLMENFELLIVMDSQSKRFDVNMDNEIDSEWAYLDDGFIRNSISGEMSYLGMNSEFILQSSKRMVDLMEDRAGNIIFISSERSISGYNQMNSLMREIERRDH